MADQAPNSGLRPARMSIRSAVFISSGHDAWTSEIADISATGVLVATPANWRGAIGDVFVLDMLIGESLDLHVEATSVSGCWRRRLGFAKLAAQDLADVRLWQ